ncbi:leucine-rich repeat-containing protein 3 [Sceloporus undulatus]|uniref:leucine-rich repeat-containing protein 3 n=1 Tax=Sceloporus undulatus TaxID=8520 RepID=UPI001C4C33A6|nr:leucine-rich repeat-containing protein 3 [Sceloporus undulatus]
MTSMFLAAEASWPMLLFCFQALFFLLLFCAPSSSTSCPEQCQCTNSSEATAVLCSASNLQEIPRDIPKDTMFLKLDANKITAVPNSTFRHLAHLQEIDLSKNAIEKIDSAAFKGVADGLRLLDLSGNHIQRIPKEALVNLNAMIRLSNNPWHCECTLQEVLGSVKLDPDSVNETTCQTSVQEEYTGKPLLHILDPRFCNAQQKTTDVAMFVTMFSWFTLVISYVVYYVRHNQEDTRKHLEYLKSLPSTRVPKETISMIL